jgi:hypothetical protein
LNSRRAELAKSEGEKEINESILKDKEENMK